MITIGNILAQLCAIGEKEITLVAPFIKACVLEELLCKIDKNVDLNCVTRWRPEEILAGVSDLEIWPIIKNRSKASLWLRADLHAKFYRIDDQCLVGSANLTATALGWSKHPNFELLIPLIAREPSLDNFEAELFSGCVQVDETIYRQVFDAVDQLKEHYRIPTAILAESPGKLEEHFPEPKISVDMWLPTLRNPEELYLAYSGQQDKLSTADRACAIDDLLMLALPQELSKVDFETMVGTVLLQMPIIRRVDLFVATPQRFGAVRDLLSSLPCAQDNDFDAERAWQTLIRWLRYFLPKRYKLSTPRYSEVFCRVDNV